MIVLNVILVAAGFASAVPQEATRDELKHEIIFDFSGLSKQTIYDKTMKWITNNIRSPKAVIQSEDEDTGTIVAGGVTPMIAEGDSMSAELSFRLSVDVREGKERVRFLNLEVSRGSDSGWDPIPGEGSWHRGAQKRFEMFMRALSGYVKSKAEP